MHWIPRALSLVAALGLAAWVGCSAPADPNHPRGQTAQKYYTATVGPALVPTCASCHRSGAGHAPIFMAATAAGTYTAMDGYGSLITLRDASKLWVHGPHTGPGLTDAQKPLVTTWLEREAHERHLVGAPPTPGGLTMAQALQQFGTCMTLADFTAPVPTRSVADLAQMPTTDDGPCAHCHNQGQAGFWASAGTVDGVDQTTLMFSNTQRSPYLNKLVTSTLNPDGTFKEIVAAERIQAKAAAAEACQQRQRRDCHPTFDPPVAVLQAIRHFITVTATRMQNHQCAAAPGPADAGGGG